MGLLSALVRLPLLLVCLWSTYTIPVANEVYDHKSIVSLYYRHVQSLAHGQLSELQMLLSNLHEISVDGDIDDRTEPRHVVAVMTDDQGWKDIGYHDDTFVTPTIDFLANNGVKFNNFYVQDGDIVPGEGRHLPLEDLTAGQLFREGGYATYFIGKWHLGHQYASLTPNERGYDYFYGNLGGAVDHFHKTVGLACYPPGRDSHEDLHWSHCKINNGYDLQENGTPFLDQTTYAGFLQTTQAVSAIMAHDPSQPMLMHFHTNAPHTPLQVPDELFRLCENVSTGDPSSRPQDRQIICGMVASVDMGVLQLLLALAKKDMLASTLIVYHSDNGGVVGSGSLNRPFRGQKATLFEGGIRVPAFMYGNGLHTAHRLTPERADLVHVSDMLPTLLAYAGLRKRRHPFDGYDHWRRLVKGRPLHRMHVPVNSGSSVLDYFSAYIETIVDQNGAAVNWKYAHNPSAVEFYMLDVHGEEYVPEGEFLFDLSADPAEEVNYAHDTRFRPLLEYMRLRVVNVQDHSAPSQLDRMPPLVHIAPPSPLGCWLPEDSMQYRTFVCPITIHFDNEVGELMRMYEDEKEERGKASNRSQLFAH